MYIDITKILDLLEDLPNKDINYEINSTYSLSLIYNYENGAVKATIVPQYDKAAIYLEVKDSYIEPRFVEEHIDKIKELVYILKEVEKRINFVEDEFED